MDKDKFKEVIYGPYADSWKILKILQYEGGFTEDKANEYWQAVEDFQKKYEGNRFAIFMRENVLLHADNVIVRMNEGE